MVAEPQRCPIVILAADDWGGRGAGLALALARRGHAVAHVSPALLAGAPSWTALPGRHLRKDVHCVALPSERASHASGRWAAGDVARAHDALAALIDALGLRCPALLVQSAGWEHLARCSRELADFPLIGDLTVADAGAAPRLLNVCDLVLARSGPAAKRLRALHWHVVTVPDGCDAKRWECPLGQRSAPALRPPLTGPLVGYAGDGPLDARLVTALAELRPDWTFPILARPAAADLELLDRLANVYVLPNVAVAERPRFAAEFDAGLAPLLTTAPALERFPAEVLEMLAAGKPVVATAHPDLFELQPDGVTIGATPGELESAVERALAGAHDAGPGRAAAAARSWRERVDRFAVEVEALLPSLDIVVVSYDNAVALARCIRSIERDASYPAHLIVVDNASGPQAQAVLDEAQAGGATVQRLAVNEGFPAAVNRGLALGSGRYVLILNDDVQLPAGGLRGFVHALARSRGVGLAGAVTNSIDNEARIAVPYDERHPPDDVVDAIHAERAAAHPGAFDIRVAALFAAIARRSELEAVGGLSGRYQLGQFDDDDLSHRIRTALGLRVVCSDDVFVHHAGMSAFGALDPHLLGGLFSRNRRVFERDTQTTWRPHGPREEEPT